MTKRCYVTTAIPYVNAHPHIGYALELIQADAIARYRRLIGEDVRLQTGTDENALKTVLAAKEQGIGTREFVDRNSSVLHELSEVLDISADDFIRTTEERHIRGVHEFWRRLRPDDVYKAAYTGLYCVGCEDFLTERDLVDGLCPDHAKAPVEVREENYFFRLSAYQSRIEELLVSGRLRAVPEERRNEVLSLVRQGLQDISISRASERSSGWGIPVPRDPSQVIYDWIDALINYISGLGFGSRPDWDRYWNADSTRVHIIGKNVWKFHAVYWPALLLSAGLPLPDEIVVHGFLTEHGRKISKSLGNAIDPFDCARQVGVDGLRYYLLRAVNPFVDGDFSAERLKEVYNADLANGLGNLVSRLTKLCEKAGYGAYRHNGMPDAPTGHPRGAVSRADHPMPADLSPDSDRWECGTKDFRVEQVTVSQWTKGSVLMSRTTICLLAMLVLCTGAFAADWDLHSDTWTATDAIGRTLPGYRECGPPRQDRFVGLFYFLWLGEHSKSGPWNLSEILAGHPKEPKYGPEHHFHHWGESELGYYLSSDPYVIRKHCQMFVDAGVDTLIMDVTNGFTYTKNYMKLCAIYEHIRREGGRTPQICFITHAGSGKVVQRLYDEFYSKNLYPDLWFRWQGKPLILGTPDEISPQMKEFFTVRYSWFAHDPKGWFGDGQDRWTWLDPYPQEAGWHEKGVPEEMSVGIATHPIAGIGRSHDGTKQPDEAHWQTDKGIYFAKEFERALQVDPQFIFITGWNEWVAQRFLQKDGSSYFVDQMTQEFSRDAEPMKGGHTDNYYYQMVSYIRRYKGVRPPETSAGLKTIKMDGKFDDWSDVQPEFRDHIGDTTHRYWRGWGNAGWYINNTGRNDIIRSKVSYDSEYVYFYVETKDKLTSFHDPSWMLLFIDADSNPSTGWHGYDYVLNRSVGPKTSALMKNTGGWNWKRMADVAYNASGNKLEIRVPRKDLGLAGKPVRFDFHWADNIKQNGDIIEFAVSGDSAPDRRFNYHFEQR